MDDLRTAKIRSHRRNIQRYSRLLATSLSDLERQYLHTRIADEQAELERWELQSSQPQREQVEPLGQVAAPSLSRLARIGSSPICSASTRTPASKNDSGTTDAA